jgi:hypothetical protein
VEAPSITCVEWPQSRCRLGIAEVDITPPGDMYHRMWGAARHDQAAGIHRPLTAAALVFQPLASRPSAAEPTDSDAAVGDSDTHVQVLLAVDHCLLGTAEMESLLDVVQQRTHLPRSSLVVTFSHTHAAGLMSLDRSDLPGGHLIAPYLEQLNQKLADAVERALANSFEATLAYGHGRCNLAANRDYWDDTTKQYVCGYNPQVPADDALLVIRVSDDSGQTRAVLVNYACHPTTLAWDNQLVSPDYPGAMRELVQREVQAPCVFLQGASGDLGPRDGYVGDVQVADANGRQLAYAVLATLTAMPPVATRLRYTGPVVSGATIGTWRHEPIDATRRDELGRWQRYHGSVSLPYRPELPTPDQVVADRLHWQAQEDRARQAGDTGQASDCRAMVERQTRMLRRIQSLPVGEDYPFQGEPYNQFQTALRERFAGRPVVVSTICNGWGPSYLVPADRYGKGIYQESIAVLAPGSLERLTDEVAQRIERLLQS